MTEHLPDMALRGLLIAAGGLAAARMLSAPFRPAVTACAIILLLLPPFTPLLPRVEVPAAWLPAADGNATGGSLLWLSLWGIGAAVCLGRLLLSMAALRRLAASGRAAEEGSAVWEALEAARTPAGLSHSPRLVLLSGNAMPAAAGIFSPTVFLPEAAEDWPRERLEMVLRHECVHIARRDPAVQLAALLACALHWFNPLAWCLRRAWLEQREVACDRRVLASGAAPALYASALLETAVQFRAAPSPLLAGAAGGADLESRVRGIMARGERSPSRAATVLVTLCGILEAASVALLTLRPAAPADLRTEAVIRLSANAFPGD